MTIMDGVMIVCIAINLINATISVDRKKYATATLALCSLFLCTMSLVISAIKH